VILYATPLSSFALRVRLVLALKGLAAEVRPPPDGYRSAAFRAIFPTGQAPVLVDGDLTLGEADVIAQYLDERAPDPPLMPADPAGRARVRLLCRYHDLHLDRKYPRHITHAFTECLLYSLSAKPFPLAPSLIRPSHTNADTGLKNLPTRAGVAHQYESLRQDANS
jgi:glutathione S-transferase